MSHNDRPASTRKVVQEEDLRDSGRTSARKSWLTTMIGPDGALRGERSTLTYYTLLVCTLALLTMGLAMVFSVQSVSVAAAKGNAVTFFLKYLVFAVVGLAGMMVVSRLSLKALKRLAVPVFLVSVVLQCLVYVPGIGDDRMGNRNWIKLPGGLTAQPSEFIKLALCLVLGVSVVRYRSTFVHGVRSWPDLWRFGVFILGPVALGAGLVLGGGDLGTVIVMVLLAAGALWMGGLGWRWFASLGFVGLSGFALMSAVSANRRARIVTWWNPDGVDVLGLGYQPLHGRYALGTGGLWGVGPGSSRQKWDYLTQADSDYVFAVLGEEFGLVGTLLVIALFLILGWCCMRIIRRSEDLFVMVTAGGVAAWVVGQALLNMSVVVQLVPVIGVPLPLISAGGSALVAVLLAVGVLLALARNEPGAAQALQARPGSVRRTLAVVTSRRRNRA